MFCPHCGSETAAELKYCKRCGGPNPLALVQAQEARPAVPAGTAWAVGLSTALVIVVGLGLLVAALVEISHSPTAARALGWIAIALSAALFGCVSLLLRFWSALLGAPTRQSVAAPLPPARAADTSELGAQQQGSLPPAHFASVTEQTTRTLENVKSSQ